MLAAQRREEIIAQLERDGAATVSELARVLDVSEMTIRRDLDALQADGLLTKVHGGATRGGRVREPGFAVKMELASDAKAAIAKEALTLVQPGAAVGITAGSTTFRIAQELRSLHGITLVTNSIRIADLFLGVPVEEVQVVVTGGTRTPSDALVGPIANNAIRGLNLDICFMGVHGMDAHAGFTSPNVLEAETNRAFADSARQLVIVADSSKWGEVGLARIATLDEASTLITDDKLATSARQLLRTHIDHVVFAEGEQHAAHRTHAE